MLTQDYVQPDLQVSVRKRVFPQGFCKEALLELGCDGFITVFIIFVIKLWDQIMGNTMAHPSRQPFVTHTSSNR